MGIVTNEGSVRIYTHKILTRILATVLGFGLIGFGAVVLGLSFAAPSDPLGERSFAWGAVMVFAGIAAVAISWLVSDLSNIWCNSPRFFHRDRGETTEPE